MTLTEFLLARIAEDEALLVGADMDGPSVFTHVQGTVVGMTPKRFLAECEAKRRIVEDFTDLRDESPRFGMTPSYLAAMEGCLRHLAAVYADHPDYDDEWKP
jgi:hypothetical protein